FGKGIPTRRTVGQFNPLPRPCKIDSMFAPDIPPPVGVNTNLPSLSSAPQTFSSVPRRFGIIKRSRLRDDFAEPPCCSARRVLFETVMQFDNLCVEFRTEDLACPFGQPEKQICT